MEKPKASGNGRSPHRKDEKPSVVMHKNGRTWRDYTYLKGDGGDGTCIDLVMYVNSCDQWEAIKELHRFRGLDLPKPEDTERSEEHTSELQSLMRISYAVFCLKKKTKTHSQRSGDETTDTKTQEIKTNITDKQGIN